MSYREKTLLLLNRFFPLKIKGDAEFPDEESIYELSCIINFYKRTNLLRNILSSLAEQSIEKKFFEVVLVEDRGGSSEGEQITNTYSKEININYFKLDKNFGVMGYARNYALSRSKGKYVLFLDDDTVILRSDFIERLLNLFSSENPDVILPLGKSSYCLLEGKYQYHDPYFPTNRCTAYKKESLKELGGFISDFIGQEDVEITVRLHTNGKKILKTNEIEYFHPPLIYNDTKKGAAVGYSFANLYGRYPFLIWLLLLFNGCRYLPLIIFPLTVKIKNQIIFSKGFLKGMINRLTNKKTGYE